MLTTIKELFFVCENTIAFERCAYISTISLRDARCFYKTRLNLEWKNPAF